MVGLAVLLIGLVLQSPNKVLIIPVLMLTVVFAVFFTPEKWRERMDFRNEDAVMDASAMSRLNAWTYCWNMTLDNPVTGAGFDAFTPRLYERYSPVRMAVYGPHSV